MTKPDEFMKLFERTHWIIKKQTEGITQEESMLKVGTWDNCMNWVVGHIVQYRDNALVLLNEEPLSMSGEMEQYKRESEPLSDSEKVIPLNRLLERLDETQRYLTAVLSKTSSEVFSAVYNEKNHQTVGERLSFIHWHETYHVGQLEILRQLAGKNDSVI